jgi:hypothetical protein
MPSAGGGGPGGHGAEQNRDRDREGEDDAASRRDLAIAVVALAMTLSTRRQSAGNGSSADWQEKDAMRPASFGQIAPCSLRASGVAALSLSSRFNPHICSMRKPSRMPR